MSSFKLAFDATQRRVVEVYHGGELIAVIYPTQDRSIKVVSKHDLTARLDAAFPNAMVIRIGSGDQQTAPRSDK